MWKSEGEKQSASRENIIVTAQSCSMLGFPVPCLTSAWQSPCSDSLSEPEGAATLFPSPAFLSKARKLGRK